MADENTNSTGTGGGEQVSFEADPKLANAGSDGSAAINFEAADDLAEPQKSTAQTLKDQALQFGSQAADRAREFAGQGKDRATTALDEVARMMQDAAGDVDTKLGEQYGGYARSAADGITRFAESLRGKEVDDLIADASDFVRKSPAIAVGTAAAVGFVLARLIKSGVDAAADLGERAPPAPTDA
jgi:ElaB/YqjD/DUF883 family membrane-anchored ribosome-binding protein